MIPSATSLALALTSVRAGRPRSYGEAGAPDPMHRPWTTALQKEPLTNRVWLSAFNLAGDEQADQRNHGGPDQALCVYPGIHYAQWSARLGQRLGAGSFGENLTLAGSPTEADVCIGDVFRFGEATVQVSQPRSPCWKIARRWQSPLLPQWLQDSGFTGWYMRVLTPGHAGPTDHLELTARPHPEWPVLRANAAKYNQRHDQALVAALAACPALGQRWRDKLQNRLSGRLPLNDDANRLQGPNVE
ncbi:MOSC domain-containing protein [Hymenobacter sp.]|uniref:MOSC domain-containing protein n=1 Tax=Hymenobacter sp. TaxID=1898978 RepID=UPI00286AD255|nr:MOSC domain-containing protein [Hymenobacter sp.]